MLPEEVEGSAEETLGRTGAGAARLLLGVSGGSDSMALLAVARRLAPGRIVVAHVQHGLRPEAEEEAELVASTCRALDVPHRRLDAPPAAGEARTETAARARRLAALRSAANDLGCDFVLLAQHRDDDVETAMLHHLRGHRGDRAWAGIPTLRPLGGDVTLLRPFLGGERKVDRAALVATRLAHGLPYADDPSNRDPRVPRSALRAALGSADGRALAARVARVQCAARARLGRRLTRVCDRLADAFRSHGLGSRLERIAFVPAAGESSHDWDVELLRLLGACLLRPREVLRRDAARAAWHAALAQAGRACSLPAAPVPLRARATADALLFPGEPAAPGPGTARVLRALLRTPLFV